MERILPGGSDGPGATEAGAAGYADWIATQPRFASARGAFCTGLSLLDTLAGSTPGRSFAECGPEEQDAILERVQHTPHPSVQRFFLLLVRMTLDGFLAAPEYGGNRDGVGWRSIGFTPHPLTRGAPPAGGAP
jgi:gluconate 2-dehydrogenase gamma chain